MQMSWQAWWYVHMFASIVIRCTKTVLNKHVIVTFRVSHRRREIYCGHARLCVCVCVCVCVCLSVCLTVAACLQ